jgi:hypothetical protein
LEGTLVRTTTQIIKNHLLENESMGASRLFLIPEHKAAVLTALAVAFIFLLPSIIIPIIEDASYQPLVVKGVDARTVDEVLYAQYLREVTDGNFPQSNVYEEKQEFHISFIGAPVPSYVLGYLTFITGSIKNTYIFSYAFFTFLSTILTYALLFLLIKNKGLSTFGAALLFFSPTYMLKFMSDKITQPISYFSRFFPVLFNYPLFILTLVFLALLIIKRKWVYAVLSGVTGGLLFYTYFYYWTYYSVFIALLTLFYIIKKEKDNALKLFSSGFITLLIGLPLILNTLTFQTSTQDVVTRHITDLGRTVNIPMTLFLLIVLTATLSFMSPQKKSKRPFILALFTAALVVMNIQLILGFTVSPRHWITTTIWPITVIAAIIILNGVYKKIVMREVTHSIVVAGTLFLLLFGAVWQVTFTTNMSDTFHLPKEHTELYNWLNDNTQNDDVLATIDSEMILLLPVYTHMNNYVPNGITEATPLAENIQRRLTVHKLLNNTDFIFLDNSCAVKELLKDNFESKKDGVYNYEQVEEAYAHLLTFHIASKKVSNGCDVKPEIKESIVKAYNALPKETLTNSFRMDYLLVDGNAELEYEEVYRNEKFAVYKVA